MFNINDSSLYISKFSKICTFCKHFNNASGLTQLKTCKAFPNGIPEKIWTGINNHKNPYKGDNGIQFTSINE